MSIRLRKCEAGTVVLYCVDLVKTANAIVHVQYIEAELDHVTKWAQANNLKLNRTKSVEVTFSGKQACHLLELPDICRVTEITILGVTVTNHSQSLSQ